MRAENFEFLSNLDTLAAVVLGAVLATAGGLVAEHYEDQIERKRKERDAARFFGEILTSIDAILDFAIASQKIGDPWGPVTARMFKAAAREAEVYERNRERLFDISDPLLRARVHRHFLLETFPLEAIVEQTSEILALETSLKNDPETPAPRGEGIRAHIVELKSARERTLAALKIESAKTPSICADLAAYAGMKLDARDPPLASYSSVADVMAAQPAVRDTNPAAKSGTPT